ncbi:MAG: carbamoyltransferase [Deltaproteobacteria bacterium]|nr:carbamoyltransferase [Deltaproteobacteria bacterium]
MTSGTVHILGISAFYHDSAACLVRDGEIVAAAQEERFTRVKHDAGFPKNAVDYVLREAGVRASDLALVAFYDKPFLKFDRLLETYLTTAPRGIMSFWQAMPVWLKQKLWLPVTIRKETGYDGAIVFPEHHLSHAASAFFPSPFSEAAILTIDGVGEWATNTTGIGRGNRVELFEEVAFPHSLGLMYSAFTYFTGFKVNSGEYKVMGLAPYGEPRYVDAIKSNLIDIRDDGSYRMNMEFFDYLSGLKMTGNGFDRAFGGPPRKSESPLTRREMDLARSVQEITEEVMLKQASHVHKLTGLPDLCLAGGVALNCVGNGRVLREGPFGRIWIQPAAGDAGGSVGAALAGWHIYLDRPRASCEGDRMGGAYLGPAFSDAEIQTFLKRRGVSARKTGRAELLDLVTDLIAQEKVVGWFQGRMEFGPRALGNRSIIGDARSPRMQSRMNLKIKFRESFRPFAPSVLAEKCPEWFDLDCESPYMLLVAGVKEGRRVAVNDEQKKLKGIELLNCARSEIPAVTHLDYSARVQTVHPETNPLYHDLIKRFAEKTGCPVIVNTSFNVRGEPIVCTPEDAYLCFMRTEMDHLVLGSFILDKKNMKPLEGDEDWKKKFELD